MFHVKHSKIAQKSFISLLTFPSLTMLYLYHQEGVKQGGSYHDKVRGKGIS